MENSDYLRLCCWNISGIKQKLEFSDLIKNLASFHIFGLLETWEIDSDHHFLIINVMLKYI